MKLDNHRRAQLIYKKSSEGLTPAEELEFRHLQQLARQEADRLMEPSLKYLLQLEADLRAQGKWVDDLEDDLEDGPRSGDDINLYD